MIFSHFEHHRFHTIESYGSKLMPTIPVLSTARQGERPIFNSEDPSLLYVRWGPVLKTKLGANTDVFDSQVNGSISLRVCF